MSNRRLAKVTRMKNPKFTARQEAEVERAEALGTQATVYELGVGEFLKTHMPCMPEIIVAQKVLGLAVNLRREAGEIRTRVGRFGRKRRPMPAA